MEKFTQIKSGHWQVTEDGKEVGQVCAPTLEIAKKAFADRSKDWSFNVHDLRAQRNLLLQNTDWTQLPDAVCNKDAWASYRQKLRDLPATTKDFNAIDWPTEPE